MNFKQELSSKERPLLLLLPIVLMALITWGLGMGGEDGGQGWQEACQALVKVAMGLFAMLAAALLRPGRSEVLLPMAVTGACYALCLELAPLLMPENPSPEIACVIAACTSQISCPQRVDREAIAQQGRVVAIDLAVAVLTPPLALLAMASLEGELSLSASLAYLTTHHEEVLNALAAPVHMLLQPLGLSHVLGRAAILHGQGPGVSALLNSYLMASLFTVPVVILGHALLVPPSRRMLLTFLGIVAWLTGSVGNCLALELLIMLLLFPASFLSLMLCSLCLYLIFLWQGMPPLLPVESLYVPGFDTSRLMLWDESLALSAPLLGALLLPVLATLGELLLLSMLRRPPSGPKVAIDRPSRAPGSRSESELRLLDLLSCLGGPSNLISISQEGRCLLVHLKDRRQASLTALRSLTLARPALGRGGALALDLGAESGFFCRRLKNFLPRPPGAAPLS
ncbi:MAG: hypothetical protein K6A65_00275 [Succinivibrionaceae bacterium]|nr:hypothetical protein [Succinivibrionaceae bacterium]